MEQSELLGFMVAVMERLGLRYLVTGSVASVFYGEPRFTNDIDMVVQLPPSAIQAFCRSFPEESFYLSEEAIREAVASRGQFNIIHPASGLKVDVMIAGNHPFDRSRFARAVRVRPAPDYEARFAAVEDVIIKKMESYRAGGSEKHLRDIASMIKISGDRVDRTYVASWASRLGLEETWRTIESRVPGG